MGEKNLNELHLFAGSGGGILGGLLLGHKPICAVEWDKDARDKLIQRQKDGCLPRFPIWDDVSTFDGKPWKGITDIVCGGFPCQDISPAGQRKGLAGERSGLWSEMARIISEVEPRFVFVENSSALVNNGLGTVLGELSEMGYNARWGVLGAYNTGLPHNRDRCWIVADRSKERRNSLSWWTAKINRDLARHVKAFTPANRILEEFQKKRNECQDKTENCLPSYLCRVVDGMAGNVERLARIGNGQIPSVAALAFKTLSGI